MEGRVVPLSVGLRRGGRIAAALGIVALLGFAVAALLVAAQAGTEASGPLFTGQGEEFAGTPEGTDLVASGVGDLLRLTGLCTVPFLLVGAVLLVRALRRAAWLDGSRAFVRGGLGTRSVDLSRAEVSLRQGPYRAPALDARDPVTARQVRIPLRGRGLALLPPAELTALAGAIGSGRADSGPVAPVTWRLRALAADPFAV